MRYTVKTNDDNHAIYTDNDGEMVAILNLNTHRGRHTAANLENRLAACGIELYDEDRNQLKTGQIGDLLKSPDKRKAPETIGKLFGDYSPIANALRFQRP